MLQRSRQNDPGGFKGKVTVMALQTVKKNSTAINNATKR